MQGGFGIRVKRTKRDVDYDNGSPIEDVIAAMQSHNLKRKSKSFQLVPNRRSPKVNKRHQAAHSLQYRTAQLQDSHDPEEDYVSWTLIQQQRQNQGPRPLAQDHSKSLRSKPKKTQRPVQLTSVSRSSSRRKNKSRKNGATAPRSTSADHFQTFTLVKHHTTGRAKSKPVPATTPALPLQNHKFLDDDDSDDQPTTPSPTTYKPKMKLDMFGLGHESWPMSTLTAADPEEGDDETTESPEAELRVEPYVWSVILSECSKQCGEGVRTVRVVCTVGTRTVDDRFCDGEAKPQHQAMEPCLQRQCLGKWRAEPWLECSPKCGRSQFQSRSIICVGSAVLMDQHHSIHRRDVSHDDSDEATPVDEVEAPAMIGGDEDDDSMTTETQITTTTQTPPRVARVFSLLPHEYCDADTKPLQWRSCPSAQSSCA